MADGEEGRGLSAAGARKIAKRATKVRLIAAPARYTITTEAGQKMENLSFKKVAALCPKINASTLKRRLEAGQRDLPMLRRAPETKQTARMRRAAGTAKAGRMKK